MITSNWIKLTPPPALPAPYDGSWYWVQCYEIEEPIILRYYRRGIRHEWYDQNGNEVSAKRTLTPIAYQPYNEPEPYVENE
jgi:hypothetical protein